ncbi:cytochrome P450 52A11 [Byssothecium circinans]|uniref:Cytochrome P450 52A11 n=1 Tax=Byssothecium circinans TaxID=147558 RepID=A0A6A5ULJ1_9PLEO|nr:cytochrome P450 52A11 [Byssothecium circinans]
MILVALWWTPQSPKALHRSKMAFWRTNTVSATLLLAIFALLSLVGYWLWKRQAEKRFEERFSVQMGCKPAQRWASRWPQGLDLLIQAYRHAKADTIMQFFPDMMQASGPTHEQKLLGGRGINTIEPRNIEEILSIQFQNFDLGLRSVHFAPLLGNGIFTQVGEAWKKSRALLRPQFTLNRYQNFVEIKTSVERLLAKVPPDGVVDLQPLFFRLTFDTTMFLLFDELMSYLTSDEAAGQESEFATAFNVGQEYLSHRGRLGPFYWITNTPGFRKACRTSHSFVDAAVQRGLDVVDTKLDQPVGETNQYAFIDALMQKTRDKRVLRDQCLNILLAGRDTTACCLTWTLRLLARHPMVLDKLRAEIESITGLGKDAALPTREDVKKMRYLDLVVKEVLRLYPSVPVNSRAALKTTTLPTGGGLDGQSPILVGKGEAVGYCVYAMHRRSDLYGKNAHQFIPERWEDGTLQRKVGYGYLPFNGGPRLCLGVPEGDPVVELGKERQKLTLVVAPGEGCRVQLRSTL